jgi:parallel beta-helix repeat protein
MCGWVKRFSRACGLARRAMPVMTAGVLGWSSAAGIPMWAATAGILGWVTAAAAANCGDGVAACACGDTVTTSTTLAVDLGPCRTSPALTVRSGVVLDCAGRSVTGSGCETASWYGILLEDAVGAEVRNCRVSQFKRGIRIDGGRDNRIIGNTAFNNWGYNVEVAGGSTGNLIQGNTVRNDATACLRSDEGIHNGSRSDHTQILFNTVTNSRNENIYVLNSKSVRIVGNTSSETDSASIFAKNVQNAHVADNTVIKGSITVRGESYGNTFQNNSITGGRGYLFEAHKDESGDPSPGYWRFPRRNRVVGGKVEKPITLPNTDIRPCLRFEGAYLNRIEGLALDPTCTPPFGTTEGGQESVGNTIDGTVLK